MSYVLGIDLGTSSVKGLLVSEIGDVIATSSSDYPLFSSRPGYSEQNPHDWIKAIENVINDLLSEFPEMKKELKGISISGQMHSLVLLDKDNEIIRPAILWNDVRTTKQCEDIMNCMGREVQEITKNIALEGFTLPKILWVQENEEKNWTKTRHIMLPKDYLVHWLTGCYSTDYSDAAGTLMLDVKKRIWSKTILDKFNIPKEYLPTLFESSAKVGNMRSSLINKFGLETKVEIFAGGADNACAAIGAGIVNSEVAMLSIGTSGVFLSMEDDSENEYQDNLHLFNSALPNSYYSMGVTLAAGNSLKWFRDTFAKDAEFSDLLANIDEVIVGSEGLIFTPYIRGERTPYQDSQIRGSFIGIDSRHSLKHFTRSVIEGITFSLKESKVIMEQRKNLKIKKIISVGGGTKNQQWLQIQADIFGLPITTLETEQGPSLGAAILAVIGCGMCANIDSCIKMFVKYKKVYQPIEKNVLLYNKFFQVYSKVYSTTKEICYQLQE